MNPSTPAQLAAFADEVGITPETHPHLWQVVCDEERGIDGHFFFYGCCPLTDPEADNVWLAAIWNYLNTLNGNAFLRQSGRGEDVAQYHYNATMPTECSAKTATAALCLAAYKSDVPAFKWVEEQLKEEQV